MEIKFTDEQFRAMVQKAIFDAMSAEQKEALLRKGIESVLTVQSGSYDKKSELQRQLEFATNQVARELIDKEMKDNSAFMENLRKLIQDAMVRVFNEENRQKLVEKVSDAIVGSIWKDRY